MEINFRGDFIQKPVSMERKSKKETGLFLKESGMRFGRVLHPANDVWQAASLIEEGRPLRWDD